MKNNILILAAILLGCNASSVAQLSISYTGAAPEVEQCYYLYNVASGKWFNHGYGSYSTQAGLDDKGMLLQVVVSKDAGNPGFKTPEVGTDTYYGWGTSFKNENDAFNPTSFASSASGSYYSDIKKVNNCEPFNITSASSAVSNGYTLSLINAFNANPYMTYSEGHSTVYFLNEPVEGHNVWQFVTAQERYNLELTYKGISAIDGGRYYLYNVKTGKWFSTTGGRNNTAGGLSDTPDMVQLESYNGGYAIKTPTQGTNTYYGWDIPEEDYFTNSTARERFNFLGLGNNCYVIQLNFNVKRHLASATGDHPLTDNYDAGYDVWQLVSPEEYNKFYQYEMSAAGYGTIILPFASQVPQGLKAWVSESSDYDAAQNSVSFKQVTSIEANVPYLLSGVAGSYKFDMAGSYAEHKFTYDAGLLTGVYNTQYVMSGGYLLQKHNAGVGFYKVSTDDTHKIDANRCYLSLPTVTEAVPALQFILDDGITAIKVTPALQTSDKARVVHDLTGKRVQHMSKNQVYLVNGKKIFNK